MCIIIKKGNKGGVGIRMDIFESSVCFVNTHLPAHQSEVKKRNESFHNVYSGLKFDARDTNSFHSEIHQVIDHTHIFWMGDLNYRIDLPYPQG